MMLPRKAIIYHSKETGCRWATDVANWSGIEVLKTICERKSGNEKLSDYIGETWSADKQFEIVFPYMLIVESSTLISKNIEAFILNNVLGIAIAEDIISEIDDPEEYIIPICPNIDEGASYHTHCYDGKQCVCPHLHDADTDTDLFPHCEYADVDSVCPSKNNFNYEMEKYLAYKKSTIDKNYNSLCRHFFGLWALFDRKEKARKPHDYEKIEEHFQLIFNRALEIISSSKKTLQAVHVCDQLAAQGIYSRPGTQTKVSSVLLSQIGNSEDRKLKWQLTWRAAKRRWKNTP